MNTNRKLEGLCQSCKYASDCSYISNLSRPTIFCEEFECHEKTNNKTISLTSVSKSSYVAQASPMTDICENCDDRGACDYKNHTYGPIMFCEDYK